uniref:Uncharacterized protein n=1 Tax=Gossypium raimondii TaxID=29730 RepID=A0A0D2Q3C4_GOSRA|nr:hypothetical protein B456_006G045700 [Gossypium raimondii]
MSTDINEDYELECSWIGESMSIKEASTYVETSQFLSCLIDRVEVGFCQNGESVSSGGFVHGIDVPVVGTKGL